MARILENRLPNQAEHDEECEGAQDLFFKPGNGEWHGRREAARGWDGRWRTEGQRPSGPVREKNWARRGSAPMTDQGALLEMRTKSWSPSWRKP